MNYIDHKFLRLVSTYLGQFNDVSSTTFRFRCPYCGDSKKSAAKTRGYIYHSDDELVFKCHNCGRSAGFYNFLKDVAPSLSQEYRFEKFKDERPAEQKKDLFKQSAPVFKPSTALSVCKKILDLPESHHALKYLMGRKIPQSGLKKLWYCEDVNLLSAKISGYEDRKFPAKDCIVIPFFNGKKELTFIQCRFFDENFRYMTFEVMEGAPKIWGLESIDWNSVVSVVEGPFDAMFVKNCIAMAGAQSTISMLGVLSTKATAGFRVILDPDYKTNKEVYTVAEQLIRGGYKIVLFDNEFQAKDINKWAESIHGKEDEVLEKIETYLSKRTFSGLQAKLVFSKVKYPEGYNRKPKMDWKNHSGSRA